MWVPELSVLTRVGNPGIIPPLFSSSSPPQTYGHDLLEAFEWCKKYQSTKNARDLTHAWELTTMCSDEYIGEDGGRVPDMTR